MVREKKQKRFRKIIQVLYGISSNLNIIGFISGKIYKGPLKRFCVPGMNCYACPAAIMSCPIGSLQAILSQKKAKFSFYIIGFLSLVGVLVGRFVCGWLCVFGLIQELLYMIPTPKINMQKTIDRILRYFKYFFFFGFCIFGVCFVKDRFGMSLPYFCKYVCPVGMLEGGIPLFIVDVGMRAVVGFLYLWKLLILILILLLSVFINRPFCKYICPLGAFYSLFQKISFLRIKVDKDLCVNCGKCENKCKMQVNPAKNPNSLECIRCGECINACKKGAIKFSIGR